MYYPKCNLKCNAVLLENSCTDTAQKTKFSINDCFSKCDQIRWNLKKSFFFVQCEIPKLIFEKKEKPFLIRTKKMTKITNESLKDRYDMNFKKLVSAAFPDIFSFCKTF